MVAVESVAVVVQGHRQAKASTSCASGDGWQVRERKGGAAPHLPGFMLSFMLQAGCGVNTCRTCLQSECFTLNTFQP